MITPLFRPIVVSLLLLSSDGLLSSAYAYTTDTCKVKTKEIAFSAKIPLIQLVYKSGDTTISFESAQFDYAKESTECTTVFQAASLSKPIFAYVVMKMADRGELDLDKPLAQYTDVERFVDKSRAQLLTARMVLSHKTGLPNWATSPSSDAWPIYPIEFKFRPDSCFGYSGEAFALLQRAVENIKGKTLQEIASEEVFIPLGMKYTSYEWMENYDSLAAPGYNEKGENRGQGRHPRANAAYTLRTTANDYSCFLTALSKGYGLKRESLEVMFTPAVNAVRYSDRDRICDKNIYWGLGVGIEKNPEFGDIIFHWGDNGNFKALFIIVPGGKGHTSRHLVYFTNSSFGHDIIDPLVRQFFKNKKPMLLESWINN